MLAIQCNSIYKQDHNSLHPSAKRHLSTPEASFLTSLYRHDGLALAGALGLFSSWIVFAVLVEIYIVSHCHNPFPELSHIVIPTLSPLGLLHRPLLGLPNLH